MAASEEFLSSSSYFDVDEAAIADEDNIVSGEDEQVGQVTQSNDINQQLNTNDSHGSLHLNEQPNEQQYPQYHEYAHSGLRYPSLNDYDSTSHLNDQDNSSFHGTSQFTHPPISSIQPPLSRWLAHDSLESDPIVRSQTVPSTQAASTASSQQIGRNMFQPNAGLPRSSTQSNFNGGQVDSVKIQSFSRGRTSVNTHHRGGRGDRTNCGGASSSARSSNQPYSTDLSVAGYSNIWHAEAPSDWNGVDDLGDIPVEGEDLGEWHGTRSAFDQTGAPQSRGQFSSSSNESRALSSGNYVSSQLQPIDILPPQFRCLFPYQSFNRVQSKCFHPAFFGDENMVVAAPTGSGKTGIIELALLHYFQEDLAPASRKLKKMTSGSGLNDKIGEEYCDEMGFDDVAGSSSEQPRTSHARFRPGANRHWRKALYMAPIKALCEERARDWSNKFAVELGLTVIQLTGDREANFYQLSRAQIIITTPEKWDALIRRGRFEDRRMMSSIGLLMVDEVHLLDEPERGATLEGLITRMQMRRIEAQRNIGEPSNRDAIGNLRIIALSATAPNADDIATWLGGTAYCFDNGHRPVPLEYHVYDYESKGNPFAFEHALNQRLIELIRKHSDGRPTLIFNATRKNAEGAAKTVAADITRLGLISTVVASDAQRRRLQDASRQLPANMHDMLMAGVCYHHAGLQTSERQLVENLFLQNDILVLCSTTTLGSGVNLPARCVIVKGTTCWNTRLKCNEELDQTTVTQMIGRAGRPQFDNKGVAVVMTKTDMLRHYSCLLTGHLIDSHLQRSLADHINAEIVIGSMTTAESCLDWLKSTFMYTRMCRDPVKYFKERLDVDQVIQRLETMANNILIDLEHAYFLKYSDSSLHRVFHSTELAEITARWYLSFQTGAKFNEIGPTTVFQEYLDIFASSKEFIDSDLRIKPGDKGILRPFLVCRRRRKNLAVTIEDGDIIEDDIQPAKLPFPITAGRVNTVSDKIKVLVQIRCMGLSDEPVFKGGPGAGLLLDMLNILNSGARIARAMNDYIEHRLKDALSHTGIHEGAVYGWIALKNAIEFRKSIINSCMAETPQIFAQLKGIGPVIARKLHQHVKDFNQLLQCSDSQIQIWTGRRPPFGQQILEQAQQLPRYRVQLIQDGYMMDTRCARLTISFEALSVMKCAHLIVGTLDNELLYYRKVQTKDLPITQTFDVQENTQVKAWIIDDEVVGCDVSNSFYLRYTEEIAEFLDEKVFHHELQKIHKAFLDVEDSVSKGRMADIPIETNDEELMDMNEFESDMSYKRTYNDYASSTTKKQFCKHKAPKCNKGECKHICCHERFQYASRMKTSSQPQDIANELRSLDEYGSFIDGSDMNDYEYATNAHQRQQTGPFTAMNGIDESNPFNSYGQMLPQSSLVSNKRIRLDEPVAMRESFQYDCWGTPMLNQPYGGMDYAVAAATSSLQPSMIQPWSTPMASFQTQPTLNTPIAFSQLNERPTRWQSNLDMLADDEEDGEASLSRKREQLKAQLKMQHLDRKQRMEGHIRPEDL